MNSQDIEYVKDQIDEYLFECQGKIIEELVKLISSKDDVEEELENNWDFEDQIVDLSLKIADIHAARNAIESVD